jgi:hypothetical protein
MTSAQITLVENVSEVCRICLHFSKVEQRSYCGYFSAFLGNSTLTEPCDFLEVKKP